MDPCELRRVFLMFDRNGDGRITKNELSDSLQNMGMSISETELSQMIAKIDVNGDGCVDIDEFGALYESILDRERETAKEKRRVEEKKEGEEEEDEEGMREAFNSFDQNGDGFITVDELRSVLSSLGLKQGRTAEDCRIIISRVDADGDGRVNFTEFKQMMKGGGFAALS